MNKLKEKFAQIKEAFKKDKKTAIWAGILVVLVVVSIGLVVVGNWNTSLFKGTVTADATACSAINGYNTTVDYKKQFCEGYSGCTWEGTTCKAVAPVFTGFQPIPVLHVDTTPAPTVTLTADPMNVPYGGSTIIAWDAPLATSCLFQDETQPSPKSGSFQTQNLIQTTLFALKCSNTGGTTTKTVTVTVAPAQSSSSTLTTVTIASPTNGAVIDNGKNSANKTITGTTNGTSATKIDMYIKVRGADSSTATKIATKTGTSFSHIVEPSVYQNGYYNITAVATEGTKTVSNKITVQIDNPPPSITLTASPQTVQSGGSTTITWNAPDATNCKFLNETQSSQKSGTRQLTNMTQRTIISLTCSNAGGSTTKTVTVTVAPAQSQTVTLTASPMTIQSGGGTTIAWNAPNATNCTFQGESQSSSKSGTRQLTNMTQPTTISLTCDFAEGSQTATVTVKIVAAQSPPDTPPTPPVAPGTGGSVGCENCLPAPMLQSPSAGETVPTLTPTLSWNAVSSQESTEQIFFKWNLTDNSTAAGSIRKDFTSPEFALLQPDCLVTIAGIKYWSCESVKIPEGLLKYEHSYRWFVNEYSSDTNGGVWADTEVRSFSTPDAPTLTVSASTPSLQNVTLSPEGLQQIRPISINFDKQGGYDTVDKIKSFTLVYTGGAEAFPKGKLTVPELYLEGVGEPIPRLLTQSDVTLKVTSNGNIEIKFSEPGLSLPVVRRLVLYEKANVAEIDAGKKIQYSVQGVVADPSEIRLTYTSGALANPLTVATPAQIICPTGSSANTNGDCVCLLGKYLYIPGSNTTPLAYPNQCIPCQQGNLVQYNGALYCPADKPQTQTQTHTVPVSVVCSPGFELIQASSGPTCRQIAASGATTGTSATARNIITAGGNVRTGSTGYNQPTSGNVPSPTGTTTQNVRSSAATTPDLGGSQRIVKMPERGNTGPEALLYLGVLPIVWGIRRMRRK